MHEAQSQPSSRRTGNSRRLGWALALLAGAIGVAMLLRTGGTTVGPVVAHAEEPAESVQQLLEALTDPDEEQRARAIREITPRRSENDAILPAVAARLGDDSPLVRGVSAWFLGQWGEAAASTLPALDALFDDAHEGPRAAAARAMGKIGFASRDRAPRLIELLDDDSPVVRQWSAWSLGLIDAAPEPTVAALRKALTDDVDGVRRSSALSLGEIGLPAAAAVPDLLQGTHDSNELTRHFSIWALGKMGPAPEALPRLVELAQSDDPNIGHYARIALSSIAAQAAGTESDAAP